MLSDRKNTLATLLGAIGLLAGGAALSSAQDGPAGLTAQTVFAPFDPSARRHAARLRA